MASSAIAKPDARGAATGRRDSARGRHANRSATSAARLPRTSDVRGGEDGGGAGGGGRRSTRKAVTRAHDRPLVDAHTTDADRRHDPSASERKNDTDKAVATGGVTDSARYAATGDHTGSALPHRVAPTRRRSTPVVPRVDESPTMRVTTRRRHRSHPLPPVKHHADDDGGGGGGEEEKLVAHQPDVAAVGAASFVPVVALSACAYRLHSLSASGCGLHVVYHTGAFAGLRERRVYAHRVYATSAGMAAALFYLLGLERYVSLDELLAIIPVDSRHPQCHSTTRAFFKGLFGSGRCATTPLHEARTRMIALIARLLRTHVPDAHRHVSGRLFTTVCRWPAMVAEVIGDYPTLDFLLLVLDITTNIPNVTSYGPTRWAGERWVDGGFVDCHPVEDARTVCITTQPFSQPSAPSWYWKRGRWGEISRAVDSKSAHVVYPLAHYRETFYHGKADALRFVDRHLAPDAARQQADDACR